MSDWVEDTAGTVVPGWLSNYAKMMPILWGLLIVFSYWNVSVGIYGAVGLVFVNLLLTAATSGKIHSQWQQLAPASVTGTLTAFSSVIEHLAEQPSLVDDWGPKPDWHRQTVSSLVKLERFFGFASIAKNPMTMIYLYLPLQLLLLWDQRVAIAMDRWRHGTGSLLPQWLSAVSQAELISSFSALAEANPQWSDAKVASMKHPKIEARGMGHPLIPSERRICNDVEVGPPGTVVIVTGSNMGGKSTLLRALGLNIVLAQSGACCCSEALQIPRTLIVTDMGTSDSLENSESLFLAQLLKLRKCLDSIRDNALDSDSSITLYLFDELLNGTNSTDRKLIVEKLLTFLKGQNAIGMITTHDTELASLLGEQTFVRNYYMTHRQDIDTDGGLQYDYLLREGVSSKSNAIALARLLGIEI